MRAWACFTWFHLLLDWSGTGRLLGFGVCFGGFVFVCFVLSVPDLSFWFRCPTMTILAQLNDCHSCNDARSIVPKKKALSARTNALSVCGISKPPWHSCNGRIRRHYSTVSARSSVFDNTPKLAVISLFALLINLLNVFAIKLKSQEVRLFTHFADWRTPPATFVARKQRTAKKKVELLPVEGCDLRSGYTWTTALQWTDWEEMSLRQWKLLHGREGLSVKWQIASVSHILHFSYSE